MRVPDNRGFGALPSTPTFQMPAVLVDHAGHQRAHREWPFAVEIGIGIEDLTQRAEVVAFFGLTGKTMIERVSGIARREESRRAFARRNERESVVVVEDPVGVCKIARVELSLAVESHDPFVAADGDIVFRRNRSRRLQRSPAP